MLAWKTDIDATAASSASLSHIQAEINQGKYIALWNLIPIKIGTWVHGLLEQI